MKPSLLALALLVALPVRAADDAPVILQAGTPAPVDGVLLPNAQAVAQAKRITSCEAERDALKAAPPPLHPAVVVALVVAGVVAGGAAGYGIATATR